MFQNCASKYDDVIIVGDFLITVNLVIPEKFQVLQTIRNSHNLLKIIHELLKLVVLLLILHLYLGQKPFHLQVFIALVLVTTISFMLYVRLKDQNLLLL